MAATEETGCVEPNQWDGHTPGPVGPVAVGGLVGGFSGAMGLLILLSPVWAGLLSNPLTAPFGAALAVGALALGFVYGFIDGMCNAWINNRLICLHPDICAVGWVQADPESSDKWKIFREGEPFFDDDYNFNLTLAPHNDADPRSAVVADQFQGTDWLANDPRVTALGLTYTDDRNALHCEIESSRASTTCTVLKAMSPFITAALLGCIAGFWIACLLLLLLIAAAIVISRIAEHEGTPADVSSDGSGVVHAGDCLVISGRHVYDGGHPNAWNEIHPVRHLQKLVGQDAAEIQRQAPGAPTVIAVTDPVRMTIRDRWCEKLGEIQIGLTDGSRDRPENGWGAHPLLDGCEPAPVLH